MHEYELEELPEPWWKGPIKYILAVILIFLLILWFFPTQTVKMDPSPNEIPKIKDIISQNIQLRNESITISSKTDYLKAITPTQPEIKQISTKISSFSCGASKVCHAKAIYYFIRDNYDYVSDPIGKEYVEYPTDFLLTGGGDCESGTIALATLLQSVGIHTQLVFIPNHAYLRLYLDEALPRYRQEDNYIYLDWTCKTCGFGEIPLSSMYEEKDIIG